MQIKLDHRKNMIFNGHKSMNDGFVCIILSAMQFVQSICKHENMHDLDKLHNFERFSCFFLFIVIELRQINWLIPPGQGAVFDLN